MRVVPKRWETVNSRTALAAEGFLPRLKATGPLSRYGRRERFTKNSDWAL